MSLPLVFGAIAAAGTITGGASLGGALKRESLGKRREVSQRALEKVAERIALTRMDAENRRLNLLASLAEGRATLYENESLNDMLQERLGVLQAASLRSVPSTVENLARIRMIMGAVR